MNNREKNELKSIIIGGSITILFLSLICLALYLQRYV